LFACCSSYTTINCVANSGMRGFFAPKQGALSIFLPPVQYAPQ
jgi:hypothetical protein